MDRWTRLALLCLTVFLVLFPIVLRTPGIPYNLKADEPAYLLMALSLSRDRDLLCEPRDYRRLFDEFPYREVENLILMSDDGWQTVYFGKPYIYSLFAAPAAAIFGANGMVAFNMALLMGMVWMGAAHLSRFNQGPLAAIFSTGFFLLSAGFAYVFWIQPEIFNMASVAACLYLAFHDLEWQPWRGRFQRWMARLFNTMTQPVWSGAVLALSVYNKPVIGAMALPAVYLFWRKRGWKGVAAFGLGLVVSLGLVAGLSVALTGHPSAYLGVARGGVIVEGPEHVPIEAVGEHVSTASATQHSWSWIFRLPKIDWNRLWEDAGYFLWGRHTGLFVYTPFALLALLLFIVHNRRSLDRWLVLAALIVVALFFLIWIPFNWHGGGGFVGNRYFISVYPAFLFLVTTVRPVWTTLVGYVAGGLLLSPIIFTPFGAPVVKSTLQAHVRNPPYELFPLEQSLQAKIPGYSGSSQSKVWFWGRRDVFKPILSEELWIHGASRVELWAQSFTPLDSMVFSVRNLAPRNRVRLSVEGSRRTLHFSDAVGEQGEMRKAELRPKRPTQVRSKNGKNLYIYKIWVTTRTGDVVTYTEDEQQESFYLGAALTHLGPRELQDVDIYRLAWGEIEAPPAVPAGEAFQVTTRIENRSNRDWLAEGVSPVTLAYHWLDESGATIVWDGFRTDLPRDVLPGQAVTVEQTIWAPEVPGRYTLVLDPVHERVAWFSEKNGNSTFSTAIEVLPASGRKSAGGS